MAALYIDDESTDNDGGMYFTHTDYQGNLLALSIESGNVVERYVPMSAAISGTPCYHVS